jgi:dienelactone hydrolase
MRFLFSTFLFICITFSAGAQKRALDFTAYDNWPFLGDESISNNGRFVIYSVGSERMGRSWTVQATDRSWKREFSGINDPTFTPDSRFLVFINGNDSLGILNLKEDSIRYFAQVSSYKLPSCGDGCWLGFLLKKPANDLVLLNLFTGEEKRYPQVNYFVFDDSAKVLILQIAAKDDPFSSQSTVWVSLSTDSILRIDRNLIARYFVFDKTSRQMAFLAQKTVQDQNVWVLKYYRMGMDSAMTLVGLNAREMNGMTIVGDHISISRDGDKIFFRLSKLEIAASSQTSYDSVHVDIRNYKNEIPPDPFNRVWTVVHVYHPGNLIRLEEETDYKGYRLWLNESSDADYALVEGIPSSRVDPYRPKDQFRGNLYLVSTKDGSRKLIKSNGIVYARFSLAGKYVIWYDREQGQWTTYRISDGSISNITKKIPTVLSAEINDPNGLSRWEGVAGWLEKDRSVLIYDRYDIWQVDPDGIKAPNNVTSGFGRRNNIRLRYMDFVHGPFGEFNSGHPVPIYAGDTLLLSAFNVVTKDNGFFALTIGRNNQLRKLMMGKDIFYYPDRPWLQAILGISVPEFPKKAKEAQVYVIRRMNSAEYPNLFFTTDFLNFKPLTDLEPEKDFKWYNTELVHFMLPNGQRSEGILYKPEDFDPKRKYPLIFYYYERNADALHSFIQPELSNGSLNIPWFVSNGYLVCVPDIIYYKRGYPGECAYQAVNAAADILSQKPWVDIKSMGLQGHSFGGFETDYIVTRTHRFAAAAPASGFCDAVSLNSQVSGVLGGYFEVYQGRLAASFWENPSLYIRNSPIFDANKVTTPLLILHNNNDSQVPFMQDKEWYNGLTHLHKKAWLLSYDDDHVLTDKRNKMDYSIRLAQFFDHYLKRLPPPKWMTADAHRLGGGNYSVLELDSTGRQP